MRSLGFKWQSVSSVMIFISFYIWSVFLLKLYIGGDQVAYNNFYEAVYGVSIQDALVYGRNLLGASEPVSLWILWAGSNLGIDKVVYISFFNALLALVIYKLARRQGASFVTTLLILLSFYVLVLFTGAERLKFSYLFFLVALLIKGKTRFLFFVLSPLSHFQVLAFLPSLFAIRLYEGISTFFSSYKFRINSIIPIVATLIVSAVLMSFFSQSLIGKFEAYSSISQGVVELTQTIPLVAISLLAAKNRVRVMLLLVPVIPMLYVLGSSRMNIVAITLVAGYLASEERLNNPYFLILLVYFLVKSFYFVQNIYIHGNGFHVI